MRQPSSCVFAVLLLSFATLASAQDSADFEERLNLLGYSAVDDRVLRSLAQPIGSGVELVDADEISNPQGWDGALEVDVDPTALTVTLTRTSSNVLPCYGRVDVKISNLQIAALPQGVTGLTLLNATAFTPQTIASAAFSRTLSTTPDGIEIDYRWDDGTNPVQSNRCKLEFATQGFDRYQILPEPVAASGVLAATLTLALLRRRVRGSRVAGRSARSLR